MLGIRHLSLFTFDSFEPSTLFALFKAQREKGAIIKNEFLYDEYFDCYICPQDQMLAFSTVTREGYREYKSNPKECVNCPLLNQCTKSKNHQRVITRHVWGDLMDEVEHLRLTDLNKSIYKNGNKRLNEYLRMQKKSMGCVGPSIEAWKSRDAYDASVCCNEFKEISHLAMERQGAFIFCSKIRNEVDKKLFQARVTSLEQLLSTV